MLRFSRNKTEKSTVMMILHVDDLTRSSSYKKVKKLIGKFDQIKTHKYSEDENTIQITVVSSDPKKIHDKLCQKGSGIIKNIEILGPPNMQPKPTEKPNETPKPNNSKEPEKSEEADESKEEPEDPESSTEESEDAENPNGGAPAPKRTLPVKQPEPVTSGSMSVTPISYECPPQMYGYQTSYERYGAPPPPPPRQCYGNNYPNCNRCGEHRGDFGCNCHYTYFSDENTTGCTSM